MNLVPSEPLAIAIVDAVRAGDVPALETLLSGNPALAASRILDTSKPGWTMSRTLLHIATDWPGHFPNTAATIRLLIAHGASVHESFSGPHSETPLHWAASNNDLVALDALLDAGADIEATGGLIGNGTALADAVAFGQWDAALRLVARGARTTLWQEAALGLMEQVEERFFGESHPGREEITNAFWCACHGGQLHAAEYLLSRGAELNWKGHDGLTPIQAADRSGAHYVSNWLRSQGAKPASALDG